MKSKSIINIILACCFGLFFTSFSVFASDEWECQQCGLDNSGNFCGNCGNNKPTYFNISIGDIVTFGTYEQDGIISNGEEDIEWIVLDLQDDEALLISNYALIAKTYNEEETDITWEKSTLRQWLNRDFLYIAFSEAEESGIVLTTVSNDDNQDYNTDGGNDTEDYIFCLSLDEANQYFDSNTARQCKFTDYVIKQQYQYFSYFSEDRDISFCWWLRSPGEDTYCASYVDGNGKLCGDGYVADFMNFVVRPALWVKVSYLEL